MGITFVHNRPFLCVIVNPEVKIILARAKEKPCHQVAEGIDIGLPVGGYLRPEYR